MSPAGGGLAGVIGVNPDNPIPRDDPELMLPYGFRCGVEYELIPESSEYTLAAAVELYDEPVVERARGGRGVGPPYGEGKAAGGAVFWRCTPGTGDAFVRRRLLNSASRS